MLIPRREKAAALVLMMLCGATLPADEAEDRAVQAVKYWGGKVTRDETMPGKPGEGRVAAGA
jgi:hypothetical protein